jgi:hypothetical protein
VTAKKTTRKAAKQSATTPAKKSAPKGAAKPGFTADRVNQLIRPLLGQKGDRRAARLSKDWRAFVASQLSMTKTQLDNLRSIPPTEVDKVQRALREAIERGGDFSLTLGSESSRKGAGGQLIVMGGGAAATARNFTIPLVKCTFDANCRHWKCKFGLDPR